MTKNGKSLTARSVKPICTFQQVFKSTYLFGAFSPINGEHFQLILPKCNGDNFQYFLNAFSEIEPMEFKIIVLDNGAFHKGKSLIIPDNIALVFLPPYSPELNPAEKIWAKYKRTFTNKIFKTLVDIEFFICEMVKATIPNQVKSICAFEYIFLDDFWAKL